jgi:hypothetical protein
MVMLSLNQEDYQNLLKILERVTINGLSEARYIAVLGAKLEATLQQNADHAKTLVPPVLPPPAQVAPAPTAPPEVVS